MWVSSQRKEKQSAGRHGDKFWEEEKDSFGARMMSKMGWTQGKGLGKSESGINSYLQAKKKSDNLGIGASMAQSDEQYIASQSIYNDLLSRLSVGNDADGGVQPEEKSSTNTATLLKQKMESRRLYSRFAKAKDTSNYSADAMREILGKRGEDKANTSSTGASHEPRIEEGDNVITITSNVSMNDYFSQRMSDVAKTLSQNKSTRGGFTEQDQENYYNMMMGVSHTGRGGLGFAPSSHAADEDDNTSSMLRKLNPNKKQDPKNWGLLRDIPGPSQVAEAAPVRQTLSLWVEPKREEPAAKKAKKDKKEKKEKKDKRSGDEIVSLQTTKTQVDLHSVAEAVGKVLSKSDGLAITTLAKKVGKKITGVTVEHITKSFFVSSFKYGTMIKNTVEKSSTACSVTRCAVNVLAKGNEWMCVEKVAKKVTKKTGENFDGEKLVNVIGSSDDVIVHIYSK